MNLKNSLKTKQAQAVMEYFIIFLIVAVAIVTSDFLSNARGAFEGFFSKVKEQIITIK